MVLGILACDPEELEVGVQELGDAAWGRGLLWPHEPREHLHAATTGHGAWHMLQQGVHKAWRQLHTQPAA